MNTLVSIVIPSYNRAHLIGETLDSIIAQSYTNWECLVTDDGSTDTTVNIIAAYAKKDSRIKLLKRPATKLKGANACRNMGLDAAQGDYVVFFDSDDLMTDNHLEVKVHAMQKYNCDYVITKTQFFNHTNAGINTYYKFDEFPITPFNYVTQKINWLTYDICLKAKLAKAIRFNENLQSGQEYNYFSKLVHISTEGNFIDEVVTLRRHHEHSIRGQLKDRHSLNVSLFKTYFYTYIDLKLISDKEILFYLMRNCIKLIYDLKGIPIKKRSVFTMEVFKTYNFKGFYFIGMLVGLKIFNKGYGFRQKLLKA
ncbi:glycosyltransferase family 2 protein [Bizionia sp.]|uniref:glycosyltransferase family 2 protein n=1 Tax=Bizionia sp. TaxID=1954480 RepID=UPI003A8E5471